MNGRVRPNRRLGDRGLLLILLLLLAGIAIVEHDGRFLVGVRQADQVLAGKAEFPGGRAHTRLPRN